YKRYFLSNYNVRKQFMFFATGISVLGINQENIKEIIVPLPPLPEQQKIAQTLSTWDQAIELKEKLIEAKKEQKKGVIQNLIKGKVRLPGFEGEWEEVEFNEVFVRIPAKKYQIKTSEYLEDGLYPVVDQGKQKVIGYSNNEDKLFQNNLE